MTPDARQRTREPQTARAVQVLARAGERAQRLHERHITDGAHAADRERSVRRHDLDEFRQRLTGRRDDIPDVEDVVVIATPLVEPVHHVGRGRHRVKGVAQRRQAAHAQQRVHRHDADDESSAPFVRHPGVDPRRRLGLQPLEKCDDSREVALALRQRRSRGGHHAAILVNIVRALDHRRRQRNRHDDGGGNCRRCRPSPPCGDEAGGAGDGVEADTDQRNRGQVHADDEPMKVQTPRPRNPIEGRAPRRSAEEEQQPRGEQGEQRAIPRRAAPCGDDDADGEQHGEHRPTAGIQQLAGHEHLQHAPVAVGVVLEERLRDAAIELRVIEHVRDEEVRGGQTGGGEREGEASEAARETGICGNDKRQDERGDDGDPSVDDVREQRAGQERGRHRDAAPTDHQT